MFRLFQKTPYFSGKILFLALFFVGASFSMSPFAHASHDFYTVSGGNPNLLPDVGSASVALPTITIDEVAIIGWDDFADNEVVRIAINTTNYSSVEFDNSVLEGGLTIGGTCGFTVATAIAYSSNDQIVDVTLDDTVDNDGCSFDGSITIDGLKVKTIHSQDAPGNNPLISVDSFSVLGSPINTDDGINLSVDAADASATITLGDNAVVGTNGITTLELTVPYALTEDNSIGMTFPNSVDVSGLDAAVTGTFENGGEIVCSTLSQTVYCEVVTGTTTLTTGTLIMTGITTLYSNAENVDVGVETQFGNAEYIATDSNSPMTDITAADANATVVLSGNEVVGNAGNTTLTLTVPFALDADDTIDITFPAHLNVSGLGTAVTGTFENGNDITCAAVAQVVTCTASGTTLSTGTLIMTGITSSGAGTANVTSVEVEDEGVAANDIATDTSVATTDSTAPATVQASTTHTSSGGGYTPETSCALFGTNCPAGTVTPAQTQTQAKTQTQDQNMAGFTDINGHWAQSIIEKAYKAGMISGKTSTTFVPNGNITRGESAKLLINFSEESPATSVASNSFVDISNHWSKFFVETLRTKGWSEGYKATNEYKPDQEITRAEFTKLVLGANGYSPATGASSFTDTTGKWYEGYAKKASELKVVEGYKEDNTFRGDQPITRAEAVAIADRVAAL